MDLLVRDDKYYNACSYFLSSVKNHSFCFHCEFLKEGYSKKHPSHEPQLWEQANLLHRMQAAIVQACCAVEVILGKPGKRKSDGSNKRFEARWFKSLGLNPHELFLETETSYLEFYYDFFSLRNQSAHGFEDVSFEVTRKNYN